MISIWNAGKGRLGGTVFKIECNPDVPMMFNIFGPGEEAVNTNADTGHPYTNHRLDCVRIAKLDGAVLECPKHRPWLLCWRSLYGVTWVENVHNLCTNALSSCVSQICSWVGMSSLILPSELFLR